MTTGATHDDDLTLNFTCPECGDTGPRERYAQVDYACPRCNLSVAHVDVTAAGVVREVFGWLLPPGAILADRYRVVDLLGRGGFAATYAVEDSRLANRRCALKEVPRLMFDEGEAEILSGLHHPGIPDIIDRFENDEMVYLVLEFGGTRSLMAERTQRGGRVSIAVLLPWVQQLCEVLRYLHSQNPPIVHRDLKPGNVLINEHGQIKLIDFGIAKATDTGTQTRTIARSASHGYSPPEQVLGTGTDQRSDVYALGATLYALLTGERPPPAHERVAGNELVSPRAIVPETPPALEALIVQALELNINQRVQSIRDFERRLEAAISGATGGEPAPEAVGAAPPPAPSAAGPPISQDATLSIDAPTLYAAPPAPAREAAPEPAPRSRRVWLYGLALLLAVGAAGAGWWLGEPPLPAVPRTAIATTPPGARDSASQPRTSPTTQTASRSAPETAAPIAVSVPTEARQSPDAVAPDASEKAAERPVVALKSTPPAQAAPSPESVRARPRAPQLGEAALAARTTPPSRPLPPPRARPGSRPAGLAALRDGARRSGRAAEPVAPPPPPASAAPRRPERDEPVDWGGGFRPGRTIRQD